MTWEDEGPEYRKCNECGESWVDGGDLECPHCGSEDTEGGYDPDESPDDAGTR